MAILNVGSCFLCNQAVNHRSMVKHLHQCLKEDTSYKFSEKEKIFLVKINCGKLFWLYLEINGSSTLEDLDAYLRSIWLECCDHMSQFKINGQRYSSDGGMAKVIHRVLKVGTEFEYEYDFGSTTSLEGKTLSSRAGQLENTIRLVARNHLPEEVLCATCQKIPQVICTVCGDFICEACKKDHLDCEGEEFMLPVVNSPRMGVCGYCGPDLQSRHNYAT